MSSDGKEFKTDITADPSAFEAGMKKAAKSAADASKTIDSEFKRIGETFSSVTKYLAGFTAVLAGGGALKKFISDANDWNSEAGKMSKQLGITTQQASVLNVALNHLGIDSSVVTDAAMRLSKNIQTNGQAFDVLGVKVRDTTGAYRPVTEVMGEVNAKLAAIHNPIEQNIAGMQVYGKGWGEVRAMLKLTTAVMSDAEIRAKQLGLIVGPEGVAMSKQYSMQMKDLNLVGKSLEIQFGNQLLPVFTRMGKFMSEEGPTMGKVFGTVLEGIGFAAASVWLALKDMGDGIGALAAQAAALLSGDLAGFRAIGKARDEEAAKNEAAYERMKATFGKPLPPPKVEHGDDKPEPKYHFKEKAVKVQMEKEDPSRMGEWEARLAQDKVGLERQGMLEGQFREMTKAQETKYWAELLARKDLSDAECIALTRKAADVEMATIKDKFDIEVAVLNSKAAAYKNNADQRMRIELQIQAKYQQGTKQYEDSAKRIVEIQRQAADQERAIRASRVQAERDSRLQSIGLEEQATQTEAQLGLLDQAQVLAAQAAFENRRNAISLEAILEREQIALLDPDRNIVEIEKINSEKEALERAHQLRMGQIREQAVLETQRTTLGVITSMGSGFQNVFNQAMQGQLSLKGVMQGLWQSMTQAVSSALAQMAAKWLMTKMAQMLLGKTSALSEISGNAGVAGSAAVASTAAIPIVGPAMAPAAGAAAFAAAMAFAPMASAAGGFDIPGNVNPIVQAHAREMILPAKHADVIRSMADQGQGVGSGGDQYHINIQAVDAPSVQRLFMDNGHHLVASMRRQARNYAPSKA
jgi:hypothetical protein